MTAKEFLKAYQAEKIEASVYEERIAELKSLKGSIRANRTDGAPKARRKKDLLDPLLTIEGEDLCIYRQRGIYPRQARRDERCAGTDSADTQVHREQEPVGRTSHMVGHRGEDGLREAQGTVHPRQSAAAFSDGIIFTLCTHVHACS